jgi:hypothetical protein
MFSLRLVHLIQDHADRLSEGLLARLGRSGRCVDLLSSVPPPELQNRTYEIYHDLTDWILNKTGSEIKDTYLGIGARRAHQGVPFSQFCPGSAGIGERAFSVSERFRPFGAGIFEA